MPDVTFHRIDPELFAYIPQSLTDFLYSAVNKSPTSDLTVEDALEYAGQGAGDVFAAMREGNPIGCMFFMYGNSRDGRIMDVALLGGEDFSTWKQQVREFAVETAKSKDCKAIWIMGREGWGKVFPDMKQIGVIYSLPVC